MARALTPEEIEQWKAIAKKYHSSQQKLVQKRQQLHGLLDKTTRALDAAKNTTTPAYAFLSLQKRMVELSLKQLEVYPLDSNMYQPSPEALSPAYEARHLEIQLAVVQMDHLALGALEQLVAQDLARIAVGEPAPATLPAAWQTERELVAKDPERAEKWAKFRGAYATLDEALKAVEAALAGLEPAADAQGHLEQLKALNVPALKGHLYRVHGALKMLPTGEAIAKDARTRLIGDVPLPGDNATASRRPRAGGAPSKQAITNRLRDIFKPPSK